MVQPFRVLHSARRSGPAAEWMAPSCEEGEGLVGGRLGGNTFFKRKRNKGTYDASATEKGRVRCVDDRRHAEGCDGGLDERYFRVQGW